MPDYLTYYRRNRHPGYISGVKPLVALPGSPWAWFAAYSITGKVDGNSITTWNDSTSNARNATAGTAPTYKTNQKNGLPAVQFTSAATHYLNIPNFDSTPGASIFVVQKATGDSMLVASLTGSNPQWRILQGGSNILSAYDGSNNPQSSALTQAIGTWSLAEYILSGTTVSFYENGVSKGTGTVNATTSNTIGGLVGSSNWSDAFIGDLVLYNSALSSGDRISAESYFNSIWALY